jgi:hypothetical protein
MREDRYQGARAEQQGEHPFDVVASAQVGPDAAHRERRRAHRERQDTAAHEQRARVLHLPEPERRFAHGRRQRAALARARHFVHQQAVLARRQVAQSDRQLLAQEQIQHGPLDRRPQGERGEGRHTAPEREQHAVVFRQGVHRARCTPGDGQRTAQA